MTTDQILTAALLTSLGFAASFAAGYALRHARGKTDDYFAGYDKGKTDGITEGWLGGRTQPRNPANGQWLSPHRSNVETREVK